MEGGNEFLCGGLFSLREEGRRWDKPATLDAVVGVVRMCVWCIVDRNRGEELVVGEGVGMKCGREFTFDDGKDEGGDEGVMVAGGMLCSEGVVDEGGRGVEEEGRRKDDVINVGAGLMGWREGKAGVEGGIRRCKVEGMGK